MNKSDLVTIRDYEPGDKNFIYSTWLKGLYYGYQWYSEIHKQVFMENYHRIIDFVLQKPTTTIKVACLKDTPSVILGYSVVTGNPSAVAWVFVKRKWRNIKLARDLVPPGITVATNITKVGRSIMMAKGWQFNPFIQ